MPTSHTIDWPGLDTCVALVQLLVLDFDLVGGALTIFVAGLDLIFSPHMGHSTRPEGTRVEVSENKAYTASISVGSHSRAPRGRHVLLNLPLIKEILLEMKPSLPTPSVLLVVMSCAHSSEAQPAAGATFVERTLPVMFGLNVFAIVHLPKSVG